MSTSKPVSVRTDRPGWFKSTYSKDATSCVEVRFAEDLVLVRDSKYTGPADKQPIVSLSAAQWPVVLDLALSGKSGTVDTITVTVLADDGATIAGTDATLTYNADEWDAFVKGVADGQFDRRA
ncbi:DUF397 domain-containing protein [Nocardia terpenica]|uniref:DUF397 domain-containing protein n=1 Tax=Nocardia terpenica TaxID=455432 RepID=A0A291RSF6_9NOCA|nr:DUF397 domain-containing protein [Nocardia terpenica]ATL70257.1 DUF397 domain-containing protein [Nocardia terpenica]